MNSLVDQIIQVLETATDGNTASNSLVDAAFIFEKARGMQPAGWTEEVVKAEITAADAARLRQAVVAFVKRTACGSFTLSKCGDQAGLKSLYIRAIRRHLTGDANEMYQSMIALDNLGEHMFPSGSASARDTSINRQLAKQYLARPEVREV